MPAGSWRLSAAIPPELATIENVLHSGGIPEKIETVGGTLTVQATYLHDAQSLRIESDGQLGGGTIVTQYLLKCAEKG